MKHAGCKFISFCSVLLNVTIHPGLLQAHLTHSKQATSMKSYAVLNLGDMRIAIPLQCVERVVRAVYITPLPAAPEIVLGLVNVAGRVVPVVNMRRRFRLAERDILLTDLLVIAHTCHRMIAFVVDKASGEFEYSEPDVINTEAILHGLEYIEGIMKLDDGLILIHNLDRFLSLEESVSIDRAMSMKGEM